MVVFMEIPEKSRSKLTRKLIGEFFYPGSPGPPSRKKRLPPRPEKKPELAIIRSTITTRKNPGIFCDQITILTQIMADEFDFLWLKIENYIAEAVAD